MISSVNISNFKAFKQFSIEGLNHINVIVGDNAVGKTALLEALYLVLSGHTDKPINLKQWRGEEIIFTTGSSTTLADNVYNDLFFDKNTGSIAIDIKGDGFENRKLEINKINGDVLIQPNIEGNRRTRRSQQKTKQTSQKFVIPIELVWIDQFNNKHPTKVLVGDRGIHFEGTNENLPTCYFFAAQSPISQSEAASIFSTLLKAKNADAFKEALKMVFKDVNDITVGESSGKPAILVDVPWATELQPLASVSGGTSRATALLLALASRENGIVMVDEIENGIFHSRQTIFSKQLINLSRKYNTQLITTTHSEEWIRHLLEASEDTTADISLWRIFRAGDNKEPRIKKFSVEQYKAGLNIGEMR